MMDTNIFRGDLVRLTTEDPEPTAKALSQWDRDSEYKRLLDNDPGRMWSAKKIQSWIEHDMESSLTSGYRDGYFFQIRAIQDDCLIGFIGLFGLSWPHGDTWMGIGLGDRKYWGQGYGTDAVRVVLRYAFSELNMRRVTLGVFAYNLRAVKSYEKAGFTVEGRLRQYIARDGQRSDMIVMGVMREEWLQKNGLASWQDSGDDRMMPEIGGKQ
jgi:RimJ/RimL family protein N-acetyltransferase